MGKDEHILHDFSELPDFDKMRKEDWGWPKDWGICIIGNIFEKQGVWAGTKCVKWYEVQGDDIYNHYYPIPSNVLFLMNDAARSERKEVQDDIRRLLGFPPR